MTSFRSTALAAAGLLALCVPAPVLAAPPPLAVYASPPHVAFVSLSRSGERYAYLSQGAADQRVLISPLGASPAITVRLNPQNRVRDIEWAGDDHVVVTIAAPDGGGFAFGASGAEADIVLVISVKTGSHFVVFEGHSEMPPLVRGRFGLAKVGEHWCGFFGAAAYSGTVSGSTTGNGFGDLYRVDLDTGDAVLIARGNPSIDFNWLLDPNGKIVARSSYDEKSGAWQLNDAATGDQLDAGHSSTGAPALAGLGRTANSILIYDAQRGFRQLALSGGLSLGNGKTAGMDRPLFDSGDGSWMGETVQGDGPNAVLFAPEREARLAGVRKAFAGYDVRLVSWDADFDRFIVRTDAGDDSGTYWLADMVKHSVESIGQAYPDLKPADMAPARMVDWKAADGLALHGVLTLPPGRPAKALPVVVLVHDGPQAHDGLGFDWWAQTLASRGYAVFQPNFRGSDGYGADFITAGHGEWGRKMQSDIADGLAALAAQGVIDPKRACIAGAGYGGYAALAGVTVQHGLYRCAIAAAPVTDLGAFMRDQDAGAAYAGTAMQDWRAFMGAGSDADPRLEMLSPERLAGQADAPVMLVHASADKVVPQSQSLEMEAALKRAGKAVEMVEIPNDDHWMARADTRLNLLTAALYFLQKYNPAE